MEDPIVKELQNQKQSASSSWHCANCHAIVKPTDERCPTCHGIQVKIKDEKKIQRETFLQRLSPATTVRSSSVEQHDTEEVSDIDIIEAQVDELGLTMPTRDNQSIRLMNPVASMLASAPSPVIIRKMTTQKSSPPPLYQSTPHAKRPMEEDESIPARKIGKPRQE